MEKKLDGFIFRVSKNKLKKYDVFKNDVKIASFGARGYEQYHDKIGYYSDYDHFDEKRRKNYYARHGPAHYPSAKYFSHKYLW